MDHLKCWTCKNCHLLAIGISVFDPHGGPQHLIVDPPLDTGPLDNDFSGVDEKNYHATDVQVNKMDMTTGMSQYFLDESSYWNQTVLEHWTVQQIKKGIVQPDSPFMLFPKSVTMEIGCIEETFEKSVLRYHISPFILHDAKKYERNDLECAFFVVSLNPRYKGDLDMDEECKPPGHCVPFNDDRIECLSTVGIEHLTQIVARYLRQIEAMEGTLSNFMRNKDSPILRSEWQMTMSKLRYAWNSGQGESVVPEAVAFLLENSQPLVKRSFSHLLRMPGSTPALINMTYSLSPLKIPMSGRSRETIHQYTDGCKPIWLIEPNTNIDENLIKSLLPHSNKVENNDTNFNISQYECTTNDTCLETPPRYKDGLAVVGQLSCKADWGLLQSARVR